MASFKDFNIKIEPAASTFTGDKIKIERLFNVEIEVIKFIIEKSKYADEGNGKRLTLQIKMKDELRVTWTGSVALQEQITQVPATGFPFTTTIIKNPYGYQFT